MSGRRVAVVAGGRTPFIKAGKTFRDLGPLKLATHAVTALIERHGVDPADGFEKIMMAMETTLDRNGLSWEMPKGMQREVEALRASYEHLVQLRDEVISLGVLPPLEDWGQSNPNLV